LEREIEQKRADDREVLRKKFHVKTDVALECFNKHREAFDRKSGT
jgi:hypothetical protein